jgi:uncharacterized protein YcnI
MKTRIAAIAACTACVWVAPAQAHITIHPNVVPAGGFTVLDVRVPNERDNAKTTKVDLKFPSGFLFVSYQPVPGWDVKITFRKLATPVTVFGEKITQEADHAIFTTKGKGLASGQFIEFPLSVAVPEKARSPLTFKALQTYSNGEVVRWIGAPDAESPAPQVAVGGKDDSIADIPAGVAGASRVTHGGGTAEASSSDDDDDDDTPSKGLVIAALAVGALGVLAVTAGFAASRRRRTA